jgi:hypothetical protein
MDGKELLRIASKVIKTDIYLLQTEDGKKILTGSTTAEVVAKYVQYNQETYQDDN